MNALASSWQEPPHRGPVRDPNDAERRTVNGGVHLTRFHGGILGGAGNRVRNVSGMRAGETWMDGDDWLAEMESSIKDSDHPGRGMGLRESAETLPEPLNGLLRPATHPPRTERELLEMMEAKMRVYPTLEEGWDGYDAEPLIPESLGDARKFLAHRPKGARVPFVGICLTGEVGLYWEEKRVFAQITFEGNGKFYYHADCRTLSGQDISHQAEDCVADSCWPASLLEVVREIGRVAQERR